MLLLDGQGCKRVVKGGLGRMCSEDCMLLLHCREVVLENEGKKGGKEEKKRKGRRVDKVRQHC